VCVRTGTATGTHALWSTNVTVVTCVPSVVTTAVPSMRHDPSARVVLWMSPVTTIEALVRERATNEEEKVCCGGVWCVVVCGGVWCVVVCGVAAVVCGVAAVVCVGSVCCGDVCVWCVVAMAQQGTSAVHAWGQAGRTGWPHGTATGAPPTTVRHKTPRCVRHAMCHKSAAQCRAVW